MLLFVGLGYTLFVSSFSQFISYFLIQTGASFFILLFYVIGSNLLLTFSFLLKLSIFPFHSWYINLVYRFPRFMFWLASTLHKLPALMMISFFNLRLDLNVLWLSVVFTTFIAGAVMLTLLDFRLLLVLSSIGNNSWFLLAQRVSIPVFAVFTFVYSLNLFLVLKKLDSLSSSTALSSIPYSLSLWVVSLSGMPPFPVFYMKILVIFFLISLHRLNYFFIVFLMFNALMIIAYLQSLMKWFIYAYSNSVLYVFKY